jgi:hypothetical protein
MRVAAILAMVLALAACGNSGGGEGNSVTTSGAVGAPLTKVTAQLDRLGAPVSYQWGGQTFATSDLLLKAVDQRLAQESVKVTGQPQLANSLRVVLPATYSGPYGVSEGSRRIDQARIDVVRAAGLFKSLRVEYADVSTAVPKGRDFVLFKDRVGWRLRDAQDRESVVMDGDTLAGFVTQVAHAVADVQGDLDFLRVVLNRPGHSGIFFRGQEYKDLASLNDAFDGYNAELVKLVKPSDQPLVGRALVIVPTMTSDKMRFSERLADLEAARKAYMLSRDKRIARFIAAAKLFTAVEVDFGNENDPPQGSFEWVIWRNPENSFWSVRQKGGDTLRVQLPAKPESFAADFLRAVKITGDETVFAPHPANPG